jgi:uncharacterized protein (TIGR00645 family)
MTGAAVLLWAPVQYPFMQRQTVASRLEVALEWTLFSSRWLLAPLYVGRVLAVAAVLVVFGHELVSELSDIAALDGERVILLSLSLIDLSLTANLLLIVIFAGYENFVSKFHIGEHEDRPSWMGGVDFSGLKLAAMDWINARVERAH